MPHVHLRGALRDALRTLQKEWADVRGHAGVEEVEERLVHGVAARIVRGAERVREPLDSLRSGPRSLVGT